jgi:anti-sigma factor RsiW
MHDDDRLWRFLDGELPAADAEALRRAETDDPALRARLDGMRAIKAAVLHGVPAPSPGFADRLARIAQLSLQPAFDVDGARRFLRRVAIAAAILAAVSLAAAAARVLPEFWRPVSAGPPVVGR